MNSPIIGRLFRSLGVVSEIPSGISLFFSVVAGDIQIVFIGQIFHLDSLEYSGAFGLLIKSKIAIVGIQFLFLLIGSPVVAFLG